MNLMRFMWFLMYNCWARLASTLCETHHFLCWRLVDLVSFLLTQLFGLFAESWRICKTKSKPQGRKKSTRVNRDLTF